MARNRQYGEDLTYAEEHRHRLPALYGRIGHRLDLANRDWTEYCHYCKIPLAVIEEVHDRGQDLLDKGVSVTRNLGAMANLPAYLLGWHNNRPPEVDKEINNLNRRLRELEAAYPILGFKVRNLRHRAVRLTEVSPNQWFEFVLILHREHHHECGRAHEWPVNGHRLLGVKEVHPLCGLDLFDILKFGG